MSVDSSFDRLRDSDALITGERREVKYLIDHAGASELATMVSLKLEPHRYRGSDANPLPRAQHYTTTVYFDTPDRDLYIAARDEDHNVKLRAREYYDLHPDLTELATDPSQLVRYTAVLWMELKYKQGSFSTKRRVGIPKRHVARFFQDGEISQEMLAIQREAHGVDADAVLDELMDFRNRFDKPLAASCLVNYRRSAWQDPDGHLRITLDRNLAAYAPPEGLWSRELALLRNTLGKPVHREKRLILEVKTRMGIPEWLVEAIDSVHGGEVNFSKFRTSSEAVHGLDDP